MAFPVLYDFGDKFLLIVEKETRDCCVVGLPIIFLSTFGTTHEYLTQCRRKFKIRNDDVKKVRGCLSTICS